MADWSIWRTLRCLAVTLAAALAPAGGVLAEGIPDRDLILICLSDHEGAPEHCRDLLFAPCAYRQQQGLARACAFRLRRQWEWLLEAEIDAHKADKTPGSELDAFNADVGGWKALREAACPLPRDDPGTASTQRNQCRIVEIALKWQHLVQTRY